MNRESLLILFRTSETWQDRLGGFVRARLCCAQWCWKREMPKLRLSASAPNENLFATPCSRPHDVQHEPNLFLRIFLHDRTSVFWSQQSFLLTVSVRAVCWSRDSGEFKACVQDRNQNESEKRVPTRVANVTKMADWHTGGTWLSIPAMASHPASELFVKSFWVPTPDHTRCYMPAGSIVISAEACAWHSNMIWSSAKTAGWHFGFLSADQIAIGRKFAMWTYLVDVGA